MIELLRDNHATLELTRDGEMFRAVPERHYGTGGALRSASYPQRPDLAIERRSREGEHTVWVLDPNYKIEGDANGDGRPVKADVNKMHAYRDAIRDEKERRVVLFAAMLYPGPTMRWGEGIAALRVHPADPAALDAVVDPVLGDAMRCRRRPTCWEWCANAPDMISKRRHMAARRAPGPTPSCDTTRCAASGASTGRARRYKEPE